MNKFNVGDTIERRFFDNGGLHQGGTYKVVSTDGIWLTVINDSGNEQECLCCNSTLVIVPNDLQVGETYTSHNGQSWVAIYEEDGFVWMKSPDGGAAYVFKRDGTTISMGSNSGYSINWEATKGPIIEEGVFVGGGYHLSVHPHSLSCTEHKLSVTTVDGVPDWATLACKEIN